VDLVPQDKYMKLKNVDDELDAFEEDVFVMPISKNMNIHLTRVEDEDEGGFYEFLSIEVSSKKFSSVITLPEDITIDDIIEGLENLKKECSKNEDV
jgi:HSP20 family molecular chaperone IbpA